MKEPARLGQPGSDSVTRLLMEAGRDEAPSNERVRRMLGAVAGTGVALSAHAAMAGAPLAASAAQSAIGITVVAKWLGLGVLAGVIVSAGAAQVSPVGPSDASETPAVPAGPARPAAAAGFPVDPPAAPQRPVPGAPSEASNDDPTAHRASGAPHPISGPKSRSIAAPVSTAESAKPAKVSGAEPAPAASVVSPETHALREEVAALALAKAALNRGAAAEALAIVRSYRIRFPQGRLEPEAAYIEMEALYATGNRKRARELAERLAPGTKPNAVRARAILKGNEP
jgi:hypothetical protein